MNLNDLKTVLLLRRNAADEQDTSVAEAAAEARKDPAVRDWLGRHERFQAGMREAFRGMPVPAHLQRRILAAQARHRRRAWRTPLWAAAAAAILLLYAAFQALLKPDGGDTSFETYRSRMVRSVLRQYQMDIRTNDMAMIRQFLSTNQAPADYRLKPGLARLPAVGAGLQSWQGQKVSMVCLDSGGQGLAVLFVVDAKAVERPPDSVPAYARVSKLMTASWTDNGRAYLLFLDNANIDRLTLERLL